MGIIKSAITVFAIKKLSKTPGLLAAGGTLGLYLHVKASPNPSNVSPSFAASWNYRYSFAGHLRDMGMASYSDLSLEQARHKASQYRTQVLVDTEGQE